MKPKRKVKEACPRYVAVVFDCGGDDPWPVAWMIGTDFSLVREGRFMCIKMPAGRKTDWKTGNLFSMASKIASQFPPGPFGKSISGKGIPRNSSAKSHSAKSH